MIHFSKKLFFSFLYRWCERARERAWKKYGAHLGSSIEIKRAYKSKGLLGYPILIDGVNHTFDASNEPMYRMASGRKSQIDEPDRHIDYTDEKSRGIHKVEASIKSFGGGERRPTQHAANIDLQKTRCSSALALRGLMRGKLPAIDNSALPENGIPSLESSNPKESPELVDNNSSSKSNNAQTVAAKPASLETNEGKLC